MTDPKYIPWKTAIEEADASSKSFAEEQQRYLEWNEALRTKNAELDHKNLDLSRKLWERDKLIKQLLFMFNEQKNLHESLTKSVEMIAQYERTK